MSFSVIPLDSFKRDFKTLQKKYNNIKNDLRKLTLELENNPKAGIPLQHNCFKVKVVNPSATTGKRGGFRTIYYFINEYDNVYLISIYSKTKKENLSENELLELLKVNALDK